MLVLEKTNNNCFTSDLQGSWALFCVYLNFFISQLPTMLYDYLQAVLPVMQRHFSFSTPTF